MGSVYSRDTKYDGKKTLKRILQKYTKKRKMKNKIVK